MNRAIIIVCLLFATVYGLGAQGKATYTAGHYTFEYPDSFSGIEGVAESFNARWQSFNVFFHFNPDLNRVNRVMILADKQAFETYVAERIGEKRGDFVFLKYAKPEQSELVLYVGQSVSGRTDPFSGPTLNRQLFLQYLYSFVSEPPLWLRDGFQAYFERAEYDTAKKTVVYDTVSPWLETAKNLYVKSDRKLDVSSLLSALTGTYDSARFYPQAWAFAAFIVNTENFEYQRFLAEACILLEGSASYNSAGQQDNTELVKQRFYRFISAERSETDFGVWLSSQHTFAELLQTGITMYNAGNYREAKPPLMEATALRPEDPMLSYYLGLLSYAEKDFPAADAWYRKALQFGADVSTVNWALGLNAFADTRYAEAKIFLETAKSINQAKYGEKVDKLLNSMPK